MEKINVTDHNTVGVICISAMTAKDRVGQDFLEVFKPTGPICEVEMRINGVEVDVVKTLTAIYERESARINQLAGEKALEMITSIGLGSIRDTLYEADWRIREALRQKFPDIEFSKDY